MRCKLTLLPQNDHSCGWIECLEPRIAFPVLEGRKKADWLVIGGGYTGLAFARRMAQARPDDYIIIVDAEAIGEGASARNSGFAVSTSCFGMAYAEERLDDFRRVNRLNRAGLAFLHDIVIRENIDCQWRQIGKIHGGVEPHTEQAADDYIHWLEATGVEYEDLSSPELSKHLGISYYRRGIWTKDDVMLQPAALARGLSCSLPKNVSLYDHSPVIRIAIDGGGVHVQCPQGDVVADKMIVASNGFLHTMTPKKSHTVPLTLTAGLTQVLNENQRAALGHPADWGLLSLNSIGATIRYTSDHRIMVRNTVAYSANAHLSGHDMKLARKRHQACLQQRFPMLEDLSIEHSWQGVTCVSRNGSFLFGKLGERVYGAGCYSGSGVSKGCTLGVTLADYAVGRTSSLLDDVLHTKAPSWIPPRPFLDLAMKASLTRRAIGAGGDA